MGAVGRGGSLEYQELLGVISSSVLQGDLRVNMGTSKINVKCSG